MNTKHKLALSILWLGTAVACAIGYFGGTQPIPHTLFLTIGLTAFVVTLVIANDSKKT